MAGNYAFCALVLICGFYAVQSDINLFPENEAIVAGVGQTVVLQCGSNTSTARIIWNEFSTTPLGQAVSDGRTIILSHPNSHRYAILGDPEHEEYFLEISDVQLGDGGTYLCHDVNAQAPSIFRGQAELVVLATEPSCTDYTTGGGVVIDGNLYSAECDVDYKGNMAPVFEWTGPTGYFLQNGTTSTSHVWSWMYFTAVREIDAQIFHHRTYFTSASVPPNGATNVPSYTHHRIGVQLDVSWPPNVIDISPIQDSYQVGDVLTCTPDSKPPSTVQWQNMRTLVFAPPGPQFQITADLLGFTQTMRCNAAVLIDGSFYSNDVFHDVHVPGLTEPTTTTTEAPTTPAPADGPCQSVVGRWTASNPSAQICVEMDFRGNLAVLVRNGTELSFVAGQGKTMANDHRHLGFTAHWPYPGGVGAFVGECHNCYGTHVLLMSGLSRNKHAGEVCGASTGTQLTNLYVFSYSAPACLGMVVDHVYTNDPSIITRMGVIAKKVTPLY